MSLSSEDTEDLVDGAGKDTVSWLIIMHVETSSVINLLLQILTSSVLMEGKNISVWIFATQMLKTQSYVEIKHTLQ